MRLLIVTVALISVTVAALVFVALPMILDEERLVERVRAMAMAWSGQELAVEGDLDVALFPQSLLTVYRPRVGGPEAGVELVADRLDLEVGLLPLLLGRLEIAEATIVRPVLTVVGSPTEALEALAGRLTASGAGLPVERITVVDGKLSSAAHATVVDGIEGSLERQSEGGSSRFRAEGYWLSAAGERTVLINGELAATPPGRSLPLQLVVQVADADATRNRLTFRGQITPPSTGPGVEGALTLDLGAPAWFTTDRLDPALAALAETPLALEAELSLAFAPDAAGWTLTLSEASLAWQEQALEGSLTLVVDDRPSIALDLAADVLRLPESAAAGSLLAALVAALPAGLEGSVSLEAMHAEWREQSLRRVALDLRLDGTGAVEVASASAVLPGPGDASFSGSLAASDGAPDGGLELVLAGRLEAALQEPALLFAAIAEPPALLTRSSTLAIETELEWRPAQITLQNTDLRLDGSRVVGGLAWRAEAPGRLAQVAARGSIDRLAVDDLLVQPAVAVMPERLFDLAATMDLALDLRASRTSLGDARFGGLTLRLDSTAGKIDLERLALTDIGGSAAMLSGQLDAVERRFDLDVTFDVASLPRLLRLSGWDAPAALLLLGPLNLRGNLAGDLERVTIEGDLQGDLFSADASAALVGWQGAPTGSLTVDLDVGDAAALLRQLSGMPANDPSLDGPVGAVLGVDLEQGTVRSGSVELALGEAGVELKAIPSTDAGRRLDRLELRIDPLRGETLAGLYRLATPLFDLVPGPPAAWLGNWPQQKLDWRWMLQRDLEIALELAQGDPSLPPVEIQSQLRDGLLTIPAFRWEDEAGTIAAGLAMSARQNAPGVELALDLALERFGAAAFLERMGVAPSALSGTLDLEARLNTAGESISALVGNLAGEAAVVLTDGMMGAAPTDGIMVDRLTAGLAVERGVVRPLPAGIDFTGPDGDGRIDGYLDLPAWLIDLELMLGGEGGDALVHQRFLGNLEDPASLPPRDAGLPSGQQTPAGSP